jgi:hypothetical protein
MMTYEKAKKITELNDSFKMKYQIIDGIEVAQCTYFLASPEDFFDAHKDKTAVLATELRGLTFIKASTGWKTYLFLDKFFNVNQTNGSSVTLMELSINGSNVQRININTLYSDGDKVCRALDLKIGMEVGLFDRYTNTVAEKVKITDLTKKVVEDYNRNNSWMYKDIKDLKLTRISNKEDGSAIRFVKINGKLMAKTKFSFESEQTVMAMSVVNVKPKLKEFIERTLDLGLAALFEIVSPFNKIVLSYKDTQLKLLQLRVEDTGEYLDIYHNDLVSKYKVLTTNSENLEMIQELSGYFHTVKELEELVGENKFSSMISYLHFVSMNKPENNCKSTDTFINPIDVVLVAKHCVEDKEGWVLFLEGKPAKIKTDWYMNLHSVLTDGMKENIIMSKVLNNTIDDVIAVIPEENIDEREFIDDISKIVIDYVNERSNYFYDLVKKNYTGDKKAIAMQFKENREEFPYIMHLVNKGLDYEIIENKIMSDLMQLTIKYERTVNFLKSIGFERTLKIIEDDE